MVWCFNVFGDNATIVGEFIKGKAGKAKWSGAVMNAEIASDCRVDSFADSDVAVIKEVKGTTLILTVKNN